MTDASSAMFIVAQFGSVRSALSGVMSAAVMTMGTVVSSSSVDVITALRTGRTVAKAVFATENTSPKKKASLTPRLPGLSWLFGRR